MHFIRIANDQTQYEIEKINRVSGHVIGIVFRSYIPKEFGDIRIFTEKGVQYSNLPGFATIYRDEGQTVYLSDDGSVYEPVTESDSSVSEPFVPTLEEVQAAKKWEVSHKCENTIYDGVNVTLTDGSVEHFSLTEHDQLNLFGKQAQLATGAEKLEYHADGQPCRYYSATDMQLIIDAAMWHVSYHTTYCNALNMWIVGCQTIEEVKAIFYGADVPEEYRSEVLNAYLLKIASMVECDNDGTQVTE